MRGFFHYNYKVLICGDREGLGRDTQGFLRGFARISLIAGVSQLSWGKLLFIKRHFSCLHLLVQGPSKWAAKELSDSAGRNAPGNTEKGVWLTSELELVLFGFSSPDYEKQTDPTPFLVISERCSRGGCVQSQGQWYLLCMKEELWVHPPRIISFTWYFVAHFSAAVTQDREGSTPAVQGQENIWPYSCCLHLSSYFQTKNDVCKSFHPQSEKR